MQNNNPFENIDPQQVSLICDAIEEYLDVDISAEPGAETNYTQLLENKTRLIQTFQANNIQIDINRLNKFYALQLLQQLQSTYFSDISDDTFTNDELTKTLDFTKTHEADTLETNEEGDKQDPTSIETLTELLNHLKPQEGEAAILPGPSNAPLSSTTTPVPPPTLSPAPSPPSTSIPSPTGPSATAPPRFSGPAQIRSVWLTQNQQTTDNSQPQWSADQMVGSRLRQQVIRPAARNTLNSMANKARGIPKLNSLLGRLGVPGFGGSAAGAAGGASAGAAGGTGAAAGSATIAGITLNPASLTIIAAILIVVILLFLITLYISNYAATEYIPIGSTGTNNPYESNQQLEGLCWPTTGYISATPKDHESYSVANSSSVDIAGNNGAPIYFPFDEGQVYYAGFDTAKSKKGYYYGYAVKIAVPRTERIARQYEVIFAHMTADFGEKIQEGSIIRKGDLIGYVDNSGTSTGPHLHYEIRGKDMQDYVPDPIVNGFTITELCDGNAINPTNETVGGWIAEGSLSDLRVSQTGSGSVQSISPCFWGSGLDASINANYFTEGDKQPIGYAGDNGSVKLFTRDLDDTTFTTFTVLKNGFVDIFPKRSFTIEEFVTELTNYPINTMQKAVSGVPILVRDGQIRSTKEDNANPRPRSLLGYNENTNTVWLATTEAANGIEASEFMLEHTDADFVLNLDGGSSTTFCENGQARFGSQTPVPVSIGLTNAEITNITTTLYE